MMIVQKAVCIAAMAITFQASSVSAKDVKEPSLPQQKIGKQPDIQYDAETSTYSMEFTVLSYNIAALPWPFLFNRDKPIRAIGKELARMREQGKGPDIVLIQEGFRKSTRSLISASGYPNWVLGPKRSDESDESQSHVPQEFKKKRNFFKGERFGRIMGSGLYILSEWPIASKSAEPFHRGECAGFDCGANKGILWVRISVPGMPGHLQIMTTHLNSRGSAGVSEKRSLKAHNLQFLHISKFLDKNWNAEHPFIFGGDLNIKNAPDRVEYMDNVELDETSVQPPREAQVASTYCNKHTECKSKIRPDDPKLGNEKQDWQGFSSGKHVRIHPISVDRLFHEPNNLGYKIRGRDTFSDHDGLLVRYRLYWTSKGRV